ncbi:MAG: potassium-transporting ATPase subunit KdpC [Gammaproteobacteria bacterium]|nr:potassium-transporting ATPase subunit KdpC [Gammaproteobacteria bacterium]
MVKQIKSAFLLLLLMTLLTGLIYPLVVTLFAQLVFPWKANGSLISNQGNIMGSALIGQEFTGPNYFWSRPSATLPFAYNAGSSGASNLGPTNPLLLSAVNNRIAQLKKADPDNTLGIPIDLVTASGSGLDPDISPYAALYQVHRIAVARNLPETTLQTLIMTMTQSRSLFLLGEPRVNVLKLNLALDGLGNTGT